MSVTTPTAYSNLIGGLIKGHKGPLMRLNSAFEFDRNTTGVMSVVVVTAVATTTASDGTMLTNGMSNAVVALTVATKFAPIKLDRAQYKSVLGSAAAEREYLQLGADAIYQDAMAALVAALIAATPGYSQTLTVGQVDFGTDGTVGEVNDNMTKIANALAYVMSVKTDRPPSEFEIFTTYKGLAFLLAHAGSVNIGVALKLNDDGTLTFNGAPVSGINGPGSWGGAGNAAMYVFHRSGACCKIDDPEIHGDVWEKTPDGYYSLVPVSTYATGVPQTGLLAEILNPAS